MRVGGRPGARCPRYLEDIGRKRPCGDRRLPGPAWPSRCVRSACPAFPERAA